MDNFISAMTVGIILVLVVWAAKLEYQRGQVEAINGRICYELKKQEDNTIKWERLDPCANHPKSEY